MYQVDILQLKHNGNAPYLFLWQIVLVYITWQCPIFRLFWKSLRFVWPVEPEFIRIPGINLGEEYCIREEL